MSIIYRIYIILTSIISLNCRFCKAEKCNRVSALFMFGDSTVDTGNNNELWTVAKATHQPYGRDFDTHEPTGRFTNGRISTDYMTELMGLPLLPPSLSAGDNILKGVNFASAGSGILYTTGALYGGHISLTQQVSNMRKVRAQLINRLGEKQADGLLKQAIFYISVGSNDVFQYLVTPPVINTKLIDELISICTHQIIRLYRIGARKIAVSALSPLGIVPAKVGDGTTEIYVSAFMDTISKIYNQKLSQSLFSLHYEGLHIVYNNAYAVAQDISSNPTKYGFLHGVKSCCGTSGMGLCLPLAPTCQNASEYMFWDAVHPTSAMYSLVVNRFWSGNLMESFPMNLQQVACL